MWADLFKRAQGNQVFVCKACQKTKFPVAMEIETKNYSQSQWKGGILKFPLEETFLGKTINLEL